MRALPICAKWLEMGCGGSKPEPEPEPEPKKNPKSVSAEELAAIRGKIKQDVDKQAEAPAAQPFKVRAHSAASLLGLTERSAI